MGLYCAGSTCGSAQGRQRRDRQLRQLHLLALPAGALRAAIRSCAAFRGALQAGVRGRRALVLPRPLARICSACRRASRSKRLLHVQAQVPSDELLGASIILHPRPQMMNAKLSDIVQWFQSTPGCRTLQETLLTVCSLVAAH